MALNRPPADWWTGRAAQLRLKKQGSELVGPCPNCGGTDRFHVRLRDGLFGCRQCGDWRRILDAAGWVWPSEPCAGTHMSPVRTQPRTGPSRVRPPTPDRAVRPSDSRAAGKISRARKVWAGADANSTLTTRYLSGRGAWPPDAPLPSTVRWAPANTIPRSLGRLPDGAAGCVAYMFATDDLVALQLDALTVEARHTIPRWRRTLGPTTAAAFRVAGQSPSQHTLALVEGPVDALTVSCWRGLEAWAAGGTSGLVSLAPQLAGIARPVMIYSDDNRPGRTAALDAAEAIRQHGGIASIEWTIGDPAEDLAEAWLERVAILTEDAGITRELAEREAWNLLNYQAKDGEAGAATPATGL